MHKEEHLTPQAEGRGTHIRVTAILHYRDAEHLRYPYRTDRVNAVNETELPTGIRSTDDNTRHHLHFPQYRLSLAWSRFRLSVPTRLGACWRVTTSPASGSACVPSAPRRPRSSTLHPPSHRSTDRSSFRPLASSSISVRTRHWRAHVDRHSPAPSLRPAAAKRRPKASPIALLSTARGCSARRSPRTRRPRRRRRA